MSTHNSREEIKEIRKTIKDTFELMGQASGWVDLGIERICYLYDQELQKAREEAVSKERARIEIELMSTESHSHPGEPGLFKAWYDIRKVINKNI